MRLGFVPWLILAATASFGLALSLQPPLLEGGETVGFPTLLLRVFALIVGAIGTVRQLGRPGPDARRWLGLPPRDWAFSAVFSLAITTALWLSK